MAKPIKATIAKLPERYKTSSKQKGGHYTFLVHIDFEIQHTFTGAEVQRDEEGGANDFEPTDKALADLKDEIEENIGFYYPGGELEVWTDSNDLLGIIDPPDEPKLPFSTAKRQPKEKVRRHVGGR